MTLEEVLPIREIIQLLGEVQIILGITQELEVHEVLQQGQVALEEIIVIHKHILIEHLEIMLELLIPAKTPM